LIEAIDTKVALGLRDRASSSCFIASGCAFSELANARLENFVMEEGILRVTGKGIKRGLCLSWQGLRSLGVIFIDGTTEVGETPERQVRYSCRNAAQNSPLRASGRL